MPLQAIYIVVNEAIPLSYTRDMYGDEEVFFPPFSQSYGHKLVIQTLTDKKSQNIIFDDFEKAHREVRSRRLHDKAPYAHPIVAVTLATTTLPFSKELDAASYTLVSIDYVSLPDMVRPPNIWTELRPKQELQYFAMLKDQIDYKKENTDYKIACETALQYYENKKKSLWQRLTNSSPPPTPETTEIRAKMTSLSPLEFGKYLQDLQVLTEMYDYHPANSYFKELLFKSPIKAPLLKRLLEIRLENMQKGRLPKNYNNDYYGMLIAMRKMLNSQKIQIKELEQQLKTYIFADGISLICQYLGASAPSIAASTSPLSSTANAMRRFTGHLCPDDGVTITFRPYDTDAKRSNDQPRAAGLSLFPQSSSSTTRSAPIAALNEDEDIISATRPSLMGVQIYD